MQKPRTQVPQDPKKSSCQASTLDLLKHVHNSQWPT